MSFRILDSVFTDRGMPATVVAKDPVSNTLKVDTQKSVMNKHTRHGYINGLEQGERLNFNQIMDKVRAFEDRSEQVNFLRDKINEIKSDPKQVSLKQYLVGELSHLMQTYRVEPRYYEIDESKIAKG